MKKSIISVLIVLSYLGLYFSSCRPSAEEKEKARIQRQMIPNPIVWDTIYVSKTESAGVDSLDASCTVNIKFIIPQEYEKIEVIQAIQRELNYALIDEDSLQNSLTSELIEQYAAEYIAEYIEEIKKDFSFWKDADTPLSSYSKNIEADVIFDEANLISYQLRAIECAEDDTISVIYENLLFDLTDGRKLNEEDVFREDYRDELNKMLTEQLLRSNREATVEELQDRGFWGAADIAANNNFYVTEKGIVYTYNPGEYAEVELGELNIFINFDDLVYSGILKQKSPISILYHKEIEDTSK